MSHPVTFKTLDTQNGKKIAVATLSQPKALNALNLDMIHLLTPQLVAWQQDDAVVCVVLDSEGDKAFCAGGDVVAMYNAMAAEPDSIPVGLETFFTDEYTLDHLIHTYSKPFLVWGNGIVMGGGLGLMSGASHRVVTGSSRIAMPEITIGLYPDVGGSYFLNKMPAGCGLFLGLTGANINATDALYIGLADHFIEHELKASLLDAMLTLSWQGDNSADAASLTVLCNQYQDQSAENLPLGMLNLYQAQLEPLAGLPDVIAVTNAIADMQVVEQDTDGKWLSRAQKSLQRGSAITAHLVFEQLRRGAGMALADVFRMELVMSCRCGESGEFQEGVRALLIDKDNTPKWRYASVEDVPAEVIEHFFISPWERDPLAELGTN